MKKIVKKNIVEMKTLVKNMPKTINESLNFEGVDDEMGYENEMSEEEPEEINDAPKEEGAEMDVMAFVDDIRKKSLRGMAQLAETPDDPLYDILKRIWQTCDKAYNDQKTSSMAQNQQQPTNGNNSINENII